MSAILFLFAWVALAYAVADYAKRKGRDRAGFFVLGILLSPLLALLFAALTPPATSSAQPSAKPPVAANNEHRKCPFCAEWIKREAVKCRFCGSEFPLEASSRRALDVIASHSAEVSPAPATSEASAEVASYGRGPIATIIVLGLALLAALTVSISRTPRAAAHAISHEDEEAALVSLRTIQTACVTYQESHHTYPDNLAELGPPQYLIDSDLASGSKLFYSFDYRPGPKKQGKIATFIVIARPSNSSAEARRFFIDQTLVIRQSIAVDPDKFSSPI